MVFVVVIGDGAGDRIRARAGPGLAGEQGTVVFVGQDMVGRGGGGFDVAGVGL